ncbi:YonK family protein [Mediterraneibacter sp. NSJ-55]|uniref:YonK family protein n=1 Tax=Mediterraneibacter hominis TaxID=2763054 RepID=A0A923RP84_9FIRM|nr:YonK family protein [Mediterraneibacter hominis]MBC5688200.1 YonK family protein [Mediterraneibacter hominis]
MAKFTKSTTFKNAVIDLDEETITEFTKDDTRVYSLKKLLKDWDGVEGISITIKQDDEIPEDSFYDDDNNGYDE